jgi:arginyl-tRNA synthetase
MAGCSERHSSRASGRGGVGASGRIRTCDTWYRKPVLYPLSYGGLRAPRRLPADIPAKETEGRRYAGAVNPAQLSTVVVDALEALVETGQLTLPDGVPDRVTVERPRQKGHGDYATNVALQLAKKAGTNPRALGELLAARLREDPGITEVEVAGPGFLNVTVEAGAQGQVAADVVAAGAAYGTSQALAGRKENVEFISANPTGPLHLGHTRWAVLGDAIARVLAAAGADVTREFYINDRGNQMNLFGASLLAAATGAPIPDDGYHGAYITELAERIVADDPGILELPPEEQLVAFREAGYALQLKEQQDQLDAFRTHFDVWFSERYLHDSGKVEHGLEVLEKQGHLFEADGALWMRTTDFGDDKDRVLRRGNGELTYFASDTAYYVDKRERGFDVCLYLLGADHHGYVNRLRAMAACAGDDPDQTLDVMIGQLVKILRDGEELKLAKRTGTIVTLEELAEEIGVDALRYSLARYPADSPLVLDVAEITKASNDNPVYYVQYGHARTCRMMENAADLGMTVPDPGSDDFDPSLLSHEREGELLRALAEFPRVVAGAAELRQPHRVARYLEDTTAIFNKWYDTRECRMLPMGDEPVAPINRARLMLTVAARTVLANGLELLGVSAPERM